MSGPVAVVTGGTRGLGAGIARSLSHSGWSLVLNCRSDSEQADQIVSELQESGTEVKLVLGDVSDPNTSEQLVAAASDLGDLRGWVNNAGVSSFEPLLETSVDAMRHMIDVNVVGTFFGMRAAGRAMATSGGRIINVASEAGIRAEGLLGMYSATKFAVVGLTQAAAIELAPSAITVNAVCPGLAETAMVDAERNAEVELTGSSVEEIRTAGLARIPLGRFCDPADVGSTVAWLASPEASYITGQSIVISGGSLLH